MAADHAKNGSKPSAIDSSAYPKASGQFPLLIQWANSALQVEKVLSPPQNPMAKAA